MARYFLLSLILFAGCAGTVPETETVLDHPVQEPVKPAGVQTAEVREAVIGAMEEVFVVEVTEEQRQMLAAFPLHFLTSEEYAAKFPDSPKSWGMATYGSITIRKDCGVPLEYVLVHEYIHVLNKAVNSDFQKCHEDEDVFTCPGSVEAIALEAFGRMTQVSGYKCGVSSCK